MPIKKGDTVKILTGKDRGKTGKVIKSIPKDNKVVVEGINTAKKHRKPKKSSESGQIVDMPMPINASNVRKINEGTSKKK